MINNQERQEFGKIIHSHSTIEQVEKIDKTFGKDDFEIRYCKEWNIYYQASDSSQMFILRLDFAAEEIFVFISNPSHRVHKSILSPDCLKDTLDFLKAFFIIKTLSSKIALSHLMFAAIKLIDVENMKKEYAGEGTIHKDRTVTRTNNNFVIDEHGIAKGIKE